MLRESATINNGAAGLDTAKRWARRPARCRAVLPAASTRRTPRLRRLPQRRPPRRAGARRPPACALRRRGPPGPGGHVPARRRNRGGVRQPAVDGCTRVPADRSGT